MMRLKCTAVLALMLTASCGTTPPVEPSMPETKPAPVEAASSVPSATPDKDDCSEARLSAIGADIQSTCVDMLPFMIGGTLVSGERAEGWDSEAVLVVVTPDFVAMSDDQIAVSQDWKERFNDSLLNEKERQAQMASLMRRPWEPPHTVSVAVLPDVKMDRLGEILSMLEQADFKVMQFLFDAGPPEMKTLDPVVLGELGEIMDNTEASMKQMKLAQYISKAIGTCTPMQNVFEALAMATPETRCQLLAKGVPMALRDCQCKADVERIVAPMIVVGGNKVGMAKITFGKGPKVSVKVGETWEQAAPRFKKISGQTVAPFW